MRLLPFALFLLAGCSGQGDGTANEAAGAEEAQPQATGTITDLTGLYEGQAGDRTNQLCMVPGEGGTTRFGLVVWGSNLHSCSGAGTASRDGDTLRLAMAGDEACTLDATISGTTVALPQAIPDGCAYYCGARATMGGASFTRTGTTAEDAAKATDLVGEPLCTGS